MNDQEQEQDQSVVRRILGNKKKKLLKKGAKVAKKLIKSAVKKTAAVLVKVLVWLAGLIGVPTLILAICTIVVVIVISFASTLMYGTGEDLNDDEKEIYNYIVEKANGTVDMSNELERPYRVPEELIAATIQLDVFEGKDLKEVIDKMTSSLAPTFHYGSYNEWKEKQVFVYENGKLVKEEPIVRTDNWVSKLDNVEFWSGYTQFTYTPAVTPWETKEDITYREETYYEPTMETYIDNGVKTQRETMVEKKRKIEVKTVTKTRKQYFTSSSNTTTDYSYLDNVLNSYDLKFTDKQLIEMNYLFTGKTMNYTDWLQGMGSLNGGYVPFDGTIIPGAGVPAQYMQYYLGAEKKYGVPWYVLAALHFVETGFSSHPTMVSSVGAIGPMQFMPATWAGWKYNIGGGLVSASVDITSLAVIASGGGYGKDGDGDGKADPWNVADAIYTAAAYLAANGYASDPRHAIYQYNHANWYVDKVLAFAETYKNSATYQANGDIPNLNPGSFMRPATGKITSGFGARDGSYHFGVDIGGGGRATVPIVAAADGVVTRSYLSSSYGNVVFIKHTINGVQYETVYAHMQNRAVKVGDKIKQGQFLGYMGQTGQAFGKHLHFELHKDSWNYKKTNALNPAKYIQF